MILIHQAIYGELDPSKGYHLLTSSYVNNDINIPKRLSNVTDLLDRPPNSTLSSPVIRGFAEGDYYLIIKTFPDFSPEVRAGRVFSHVLIVNKNDLSKINNISEILDYHFKEVDKHATLVPIELENLNIKISKGNHLGRISSAINGIVNHSQNNNTIVWIGEEGYIDWINSFYKNLPIKVKESLKIGVAYSPQRISTDILNVVYIPTELKANWGKMQFKLIGIDENEQLESKTAHLLLDKREEAKDLYNLINEFCIQIDEVDDLVQLEKVVPTYLSIDNERTQLKDLLIFADLISNFSPKRNLAKQSKQLLIKQIASRLVKANSDEVSVLPNINWSGFSSFEKDLTKALNNWLKANLFVKGLSSKNAIVVKKGFIGSSQDWWNTEVRQCLEEQFSHWDKVYASLAWEWFLTEPDLIDAFKTVLPNEFEYHILESTPKIKLEVGEDLLNLSEYKGWYKFYAYICCELFSPKDALNQYLRLSENERLSEGLELISNLISVKSFVDYSISNPSHELIEISSNLIKKKPSIISKIDVSKQGWIDLWGVCEVKGISAFSYVNHPLNLTYDLLSEYLNGKDISPDLLQNISKSRYNDLSTFPERIKIWQTIGNPEKANFVNATSKFNEFQKYLLSNEFTQFEENFKDKRSEEKYIEKLILNKKDYRNSNLILGFFEKFTLSQDLFLLLLAERHTAFDLLESKLIGELIKRKDWKDSHKIIKNKYAINNSNLKIAVDISISLSLPNFFSWDFYKKSTNKSSMSKENKNIDYSKKILIVVATQTEAKMVLSRMKEHGSKPKAITLDKMVFWELGTINGSYLLMQKTTTMGSSGAGGSTLSISDAIKSVQPDAVVMLGIAFGLNREKQEIGRVLVSKQIEGYELSKIKKDVAIQRAPKIPASHSLVNLFENAELEFNQCGLEFGLMISGEKLVDNELFVKRLQDNYPEAIGGEMEGEGLQSACHRNNVDWILMKGICDWGYDKNTPTKEEDQNLAISNACDFFIHALNSIQF